MELAVREAKARLSELIAAARKGERVVITKHGVPAVEFVRCRPRGAIDFEKLAETYGAASPDPDPRIGRPGNTSSTSSPSRTTKVPPTRTWRMPSEYRSGAS